MAAAPQYAAADEILATARLRGGFDSNPTLVIPARGSAFTGADAELTSHSETDAVDVKFEAAARLTDFSDLPIDPARHSNLLLDVSNKDQNGVSLKSFSRMEDDRSYDNRAFAATQRLRAQWVGSRVRPYLTGEARYATLNETNDFRPVFLPEPQRFLRATIIPGLALNFDQIEVGSSINLSQIRYDDLPEFAPRRDGDRMQPFLFLSYVSDRLDIFASLSQLYASWQDPAFADLRQTMFETTIKFKTKPLGLELQAKKEAAETTFDFSPVTIATLLSAKLSWDINDKTTLGASVRRLQADFVQTPFTTQIFSYGFGVNRSLFDSVSLGIDVTRIHSTTIFGGKPHATVAMVSLAKRFGGEDEKRAASLPPGALIESPALRTPSGW